MAIKPKIRKQVLSEFDSEHTIDEVAILCGVSVGSVFNIWREGYGAEACAERKRRLNSGEKHHNWKGGVTHTSRGYKIIRAPSWYKGYVDPAGRAPEHMILWCEYNGKTEVPEGSIVHHRNEDKLDNTKDNLELLSKSEHAATHATKRIRDWDGRFI